MCSTQKIKNNNIKSYFYNENGKVRFYKEAQYKLTYTQTQRHTHSAAECSLFLNACTDLIDFRSAGSLLQRAGVSESTPTWLKFWEQLKSPCLKCLTGLETLSKSGM